MMSEKKIDDYGQVSVYFVGPLNLNRRTKQATTVMGLKLSLCADEFDALDILAAREDEPMTFDLLYSEVWGARDGSYKRESAYQMLNNLVRKVKDAGAGFMWIEYEAESGYTFRTHWSHNWQSSKAKAIS